MYKYSKGSLVSQKTRYHQSPSRLILNHSGSVYPCATWGYFARTSWSFATARTFSRFDRCWTLSTILYASLSWSQSWTMATGTAAKKMVKWQCENSIKIREILSKIDGWYLNSNLLSTINCQSERKGSVNQHRRNPNRYVSFGFLTNRSIWGRVWGWNIALPSGTRTVRLQANMWSVVTYLARSKHLKVPSGWDSWFESGAMLQKGCFLKPFGQPAWWPFSSQARLSPSFSCSSNVVWKWFETALLNYNPVNFFHALMFGNQIALDFSKKLPRFTFAWST